MLENKKINCFLIGVQKAGTSSFYNWLSQHPDINAPAQMKDFHYFFHEDYMRKGTNWLESFYSKHHQKPIFLNGAVNYIYDPECPGRIKEYNPESKFIVILRDPVKRAFSAYQYFKKLGTEKRTFKQAIKDELEGKFTAPKYHYAYIDHGFYYKQLSHWFKYYKQDRFFVLIYENLFRFPQIALQNTFDFLNVDRDFLPSQLNTINRTGKAKYKWLNNLVFTNKKFHSFSKKFLHLDKLIPLEKRILFLNWLRDWNTSGKSETEKLSLEQYSEISLSYIEDRKKLSSLLNTNFEKVWQFQKSN